MSTVLVVEDERWEREGLSQLIQGMNLPIRQVLAADDGTQGLAMIRLHCPEIIITDVKMPGMSGLDMLLAAKAWVKNSAIIILSGFNEFEYAKTALKIGALDYLLKPIEEDLLEEALRTALETLHPAPVDTGEGLPLPEFPEMEIPSGEGLSATERYVLMCTVNLLKRELSNPYLTLRMVASSIYLSPNYVGVLFKKVVGLTFNDYLSKYRMRVASDLLRVQGTKISWVANQVGIPNTSYFGVLFKHYYGMPPSEYRRRMAGN